MNLRKTIKTAGLTQEAAASALGVSVSTLHSWLTTDIPNEPAALAHMWARGLAYVRRSGDGWKVVPVDDLAGRYATALDLVAMATTQAREYILSGPDAVTEKDSPNNRKGLTGTHTAPIVPNMRTSRAKTGATYPDEKAEKTGVYLYPSQKEALMEKAAAEGLSMGDAMRQAIEIWMARREIPTG